MSLITLHDRLRALRAQTVALAVVAVIAAAVTFHHADPAMHGDGMSAVCVAVMDVVAAGVAATVVRSLFAHRRVSLTPTALVTVLARATIWVAPRAGPPDSVVLLL